MSKKSILRKAFLICDWSKEYHIKYQNKRKIATRKTDCLFNMLARLKIDE